MWVPKSVHTHFLSVWGCLISCIDLAAHRDTNELRNILYKCHYPDYYCLPNGNWKVASPKPMQAKTVEVSAVTLSPVTTEVENLLCEFVYIKNSLLNTCAVNSFSCELKKTNLTWINYISHLSCYFLPAEFLFFDHFCMSSNKWVHKRSNVNLYSFVWLDVTNISCTNKLMILKTVNKLHENTKTPRKTSYQQSQIPPPLLAYRNFSWSYTSHYYQNVFIYQTNWHDL